MKLLPHFPEATDCYDINENILKYHEGEFANQTSDSTDCESRILQMNLDGENTGTSIIEYTKYYQIYVDHSIEYYFKY